MDNIEEQNKVSSEQRSLFNPPSIIDIKSAIVTPFKMPLISESYLRASQVPVPKIVLDNAGLLINLKKISQDEYKNYVKLLSTYLIKNPDKLKELHTEFFKGKPPYLGRIGRVSLEYQEVVLDYVSVNGKTLNQIINECIFDSYSLTDNLNLTRI